MALGKGRHSKRSSSTSYTSTITTVVVIALCVLGVWMLTSDSIASPQSTTRTSAPDERTTTNTISTKADDKSFEDNPGDLPDDAVKSGDQKPDPSKDDATESNDGGGNEGLNQNDRSENGGEAAAESKKDEGQTNGTDQSGVDENNTQGLHGQDSAEEQTKENREEIHESAEESSVTQTQKPTDNNLETGTLTSSDDKDNNAAENSKGNDEGGNEGQDQIKSENSIQEGENIDNDPQAGRKGDSSQEGETESGSSTTEEKPFFSDEDQPLGKHYPVKTSTLSDEASKNTTTTHDNEGKSKTEDTEQVESTRQSKTSYGTEETNQDPKQQEGGSSQGAAQDTPTSYENSSETSSLPNSGIPKESKESKKSWSTQVTESDNEKERRKDTSEGQNDRESMYGYSWHLCNVTAGQDYIPCLDNEEAIKKLRSRKHFEHRERHCPVEPPTCLVPLPEGYKTPVPWPQSRDKIWFHNVPHKELAEVKGHQNWVKLTGEFLTFPGGGTQFIHGALHYIDFIQKAVPAIAWGRHTRVILDVGCGVASFGGYLFERDVLAISLAPKDEHEAQVQFALERGIPAISAVMGSQRLPFPSNIFDVVHCARCRVPWYSVGGRLLLELNRLLRPGGFFVWSATPVYREFPEDVEIWKGMISIEVCFLSKATYYSTYNSLMCHSFSAAMSTLTASMCWKVETIQKDDLNMIGAAIYRKPKSNECYEQKKENGPPMCKSDDDANAAWYIIFHTFPSQLVKTCTISSLQSCMHRVPIDESERGSKWPARWPKRLATPPYWLNKSQMGIYGKPAPDDFTTDHEHWKKVLKTSYLTGLGFSWRNVRNVMDMRALQSALLTGLPQP